MKIIILNGSPRNKGTVAILLKAISEGLTESHDAEWIDVYALNIKPCIACMKCRPDNECVLPKDDAHVLGRKIKEADCLVVGTPTHWGNMSSMLKHIFDRNVPVFMGEKPNGMPIPRQKGKLAIIATACTTPWPFNFILPESRGALRAVKEVLHYGGYKIVGTVTKPGTKKSKEISSSMTLKARRLGSKMVQRL